MTTQSGGKHWPTHERISQVGEAKSYIDAIIVHFNNPKQLTETINVIRARVGSRVTVVDNSDDVELASAAYAIATRLGAHYLATPTNLGWGASINYWLSEVVDQRPLMLVLAHDAKLKRFEEQVVISEISNKSVFAVSPENAEQSTCYYSHSRFFWFSKNKPRKSSYEVPVGHSTAILFKTEKVKFLLFDEEFFIYGCESEIFLRAGGVGLKTIQTTSFQVRNPSTDSERRFVRTAFLVNSLYCASKHGGVCGLISRSIRIGFSIFRDARVEKLRFIIWAWKNPGKGFRTYRKTWFG
ncbi:MAG: glycosyltransferase [Balneolaceae bacterium]|nr:glycosyltransferase [Balneolaceae bacterium]